MVVRKLQAQPLVLLIFQPKIQGHGVASVWPGAGCGGRVRTWGKEQSVGREVRLTSETPSLSLVKSAVQSTPEIT